MAFQKGRSFVGPYYAPLDQYGKPMPLATLVFWITGSGGPLAFPIKPFSDAALTSQYPSNIITADANGRFPLMYFNAGQNASIVRAQLFDKFGRLQAMIDPWSSVTRSYLVATKPSATQITNNAVPGPDADLRIFMPFAGTWRYRTMLEFVTNGSTGATPGLSMSMVMAATRLGGPVGTRGPFADHFASSVALLGNMDGAVTTADGLNDSGSGIDGFVNYSLNGTGALNAIEQDGVFTTTAPAWIIVWWAQQNSSSNYTQLSAGSYIQVELLQG